MAAYLETEIQTEPLYSYVAIIIFLKLNPLPLLLDYLFLVGHTVPGNIAGLNSSISIWQMLKISWRQDTIRGCLSLRSICNQCISAQISTPGPCCSQPFSVPGTWALGSVAGLLSPEVTIRCPHHTHIKLHIPTKKY